MLIYPFNVLDVTYLCHQHLNPLGKYSNTIIVFRKDDLMCSVKILSLPDYHRRGIRACPSTQLIISCVDNDLCTHLRGLPPVTITNKLMILLCINLLSFGLGGWC